MRRLGLLRQFISVAFFAGALWITGQLAFQLEYLGQLRRAKRELELQVFQLLAENGKLRNTYQEDVESGNDAPLRRARRATAPVRSGQGSPGGPPAEREQGRPDPAHAAAPVGPKARRKR